MQQRHAARLVALCALLLAMCLASACGEGTIVAADGTDVGLGTNPGASASGPRDGGTVTARDAGSDGAAPAGEGTSGSGTTPAASWNGMRVGTNFWFLSSWAEDAWASSPNFAGDNPWSATFLSDVKASKYGVFRFMDWGGTNNSTIRSWSERTQQTSDDNLHAGDVGGRGIAYEWMFDLCNRMQADCWITVPHLAIESYEADPSDNYFTSLAKLAKDKLDPGLALYLEYSNETWNAGFQQAQYCQSRGASLGLSDDAYAASFKFHVYASSRMYEAFLGVFGGDASRLRWVVAGQLSSDYGTQQQVAALADAAINQGRRTPHFYAISNYVGSGGGIDGAASDVTDQFAAGIRETIGWAKQQKSTIASTGMKLVAYEGGQHITTHAADFSRNPAAYDLYTRWLDAVSDVYALTVHYGFSGSYDDVNGWGSKERAGQPLSETPKARALLDWIGAHE